MKLLRRLLNRWRRKWNQFHIIHKMLLFYMPLIVLPTILGMYYVTSNFYQTSRTVMTENTEDLLDLVIEKLEQEFQNFEALSLQFFVDSELRRILQTTPETYLETASNKIAMEKRVQILLGSFRPYVRGVILTSPNAQYLIGSRETIQQNDAYESFLERVKQGEGSVVWGLNTTTIQGKQIILLGRHINDLERFNPIAEMVFVIDPRIFAYVLQETKISQNAKFELYAGNVEEEFLILSTGSDVPEPEHRNLSTTVQSNKYNWTLKTLIPLEKLNEQTRQTVILSIIVTLLCIALGIGATQLIVVDMVVPIRKLMRNMRMGIKGARPRDLIRFKGAREITELNDTFISVLYEVYNLNQEIIKTHKKRQQIEMKVLQNQITPHFLYNTLNSIRWMAIIQKQDHIKEMVDSLIRLLTYSLQETNQPVLLADEIESLQDYIKIQKVRYYDFKLHVDIPERLMKVQVLKFLLQPIIENAVIHGIADSDRSGEITIKANEHPDSQLNIVISDNGNGMNETTLRKIQRILESEPEAQEGLHLGIRNIQERIQVHYGPTYGLRINSVEKEGTTVHLILPMNLGVNISDNGG